MERQMITAEPSYYDYLMKNRCVRRTRVPFAQAVGVMPELTRNVRSSMPQRTRPVPAARLDHGFGRDAKAGQ